MVEGGILKAGIPEELVEDEMVRRVYLRTEFRIAKKEIGVLRKVISVQFLSDQSKN